MESTSIDGLFQQIIDSEQAAQRRRDLLNECKQQVYVSQEKIKLLQKECCHLQRSLEQKLTELSEKELQTKSLKIQEKIIQQEKDDLQQQISSLNQKQEELQTAFVKQQEEYCEHLAHMSSSFGLNRQAHEERKDKFSEELTALLKEETELKYRLQQYTDKKNIIDGMLAERVALQSKLDTAVSQNNKVNALLSDALGTTAKLEKQRLVLLEQPLAWQTFTSLQSELDKEKEMATNLDGEIYQLQAQLQEANQKLWQKQVQQQQQMQEQLKQKQADQAKQQTSKCNQKVEDWDGCDMELMMEEFRDEDTDNSTGAVQPNVCQEVPSGKKSIFRSGKKNT